MSGIMRWLMLGLMVASAFDALAAPLDLADVPSNPAWVLHLDCDALRKAYLGQYLLFQLGKPQMYSNMVSLRSMFGFDFRTHLHGLTLYDSDSAAENNVLIAYADLERNHLIAFFRIGKKAETLVANGNVIYSWIDQHQNGGRRYAAMVKNRLIGATRKESLLAALAVIEGRTPSLASSKAASEFGEGGEGTFLQAAAKNLDFIDSQPYAALFRSARRVKLEAGETNQRITARLTAHADNEDTATQMTLAARGLIAFLRLQGDDSPLDRLAGKIVVNQEGNTITATLSARSIEVINAIKAYNSGNGKKAAAP